MQNRLMLPAWLGAGEALQIVLDEGKLQLLQDMVQEWPFFRARLSMLEMVFAKSDHTRSAQHTRTQQHINKNISTMSPSTITEKMLNK